MFTFGIFTTHIPYIAMLAFYAWFLIFGVNKLGDGAAKVAATSHTVQMHVNHSAEQAPADTFSYYSSLLVYSKTFIAKEVKAKQKWKYLDVDTTCQEDHPKNELFGRPPPNMV